jgi:hypothetical protein
LADQAITELLAKAPFAFVGTVEHLGASTMSSVEIHERTAVVHVDHILHSPPAFSTLAGQLITVQLSEDEDPPAVGESWAFFTEGVAFGESVVVAEAGRLPVDQVEPQVTASFEAGEQQAFSSLQREVDQERLRQHAAQAAAIVVGRVVALARAGGAVVSEHDPDWWKATIDVYHVERGNVEPGELTFLYANSLDVRWHTAPKPKASQGGLWILHSTEGPMRELAPFQILHPEDFQPLQELDVLRDEEG